VRCDIWREVRRTVVLKKGETRERDLRRDVRPRVLEPIENDRGAGPLEPGRRHFLGDHGRLVEQNRLLGHTSGADKNVLAVSARQDHRRLVANEAQLVPESEKGT
jgi:hypothetical protein